MRALGYLTGFCNALESWVDVFVNPTPAYREAVGDISDGLAVAVPGIHDGVTNRFKVDV